MNFEKKLLISIALGILITGCGGGGEEITQSNPNTEAKDPLIAFKTQKIEWGSCDAYFSKYADPDMEYYSAMLGDRLQCADISAPLDYNNPEKATVKIAVLRVLSTKNSDKNPNLFFNPGGPGVDGQMYSIIYSSKLYETGNKNTPLGSAYQRMAENFNLVGFSPRGVGESTTISCSGNEYFLPIDYTKNGNNPDNIKSITNYAKAVAKNCQKSPVSDYINTDATARDMDLIRHLLGDEKMHYYGKSYGT